MVVLALAACSPTPPAVISSSTSPPPTTTTSVDQAGAVHEVFFDFAKALRDKDGDAALATMASASIARWETYRVHALKSTENQLAALPAGERAIVYGLRVTAGPALRTGTGRTVLIDAVRQGLIAMNTSTRLVHADGTTTVNETTPDLTRLILGADTATGEVGSNDPSAPALSTPFKFTFVREGENWKVDPAGPTEATTSGLEDLAAKKGTTADQVLTEVLTSQFGAARATELRKPLDG
jgi:hypothetical protein